MREEKQVLKEILDAREKRAEMQRELIDTYKNTLISFTLNIPGTEKCNSTFTKVHEKGIKLLEEELEKKNIKVLHETVRVAAGGDEAFLVVDADSWCIKRITTSIEENHELGRLFDIDVFNEDGELTSRTGIDLPARRCLLCSNSAKACARSREHSIEALMNKVNYIIKSYSID
ncbi:citrate lyase holo-[acyl-carrier protein] synthase [Clostridium saccharoperbutylacetonicum]|uniref:citrate lyase holo-[acyl-carrier protein] synthase n=1 Tax=Clostridium saccharoperbutylacetonicum TaxID=36745 RepID=UPI0039E786E3